MSRLLLGIAWILLSILGLRMLQMGLGVRRRVLMRWGLSKAAVVGSEIDTTILGLARPRIIYEYDVGHHYFLGQLRPWGWGWGPRRQAERGAAQFPPGTMFSVYVDPNDHQRAMLRPWPSLWHCGLLAVVNVVSAGLGISLIVTGLRQLLS